MTTLSRTFPRARKPYACFSCRGPIAQGERYHRLVARGDEWTGLATLIECAACCERYGRPLPTPATASGEIES